MRKVRNFPLSEMAKILRTEIWEVIAKSGSSGMTVNYDHNDVLTRISDLPSIKKVINNAIDGIPTKSWAHGLAVYQKQCKAIERDVFSIKPRPIDSALSNFLKFLYAKVMFNDDIWPQFGIGSCSKRDIKRSFFSNQGNSICVYCDIHEDSEANDFEIDHILPTSKFPSLAFHENNLIPICASCNSMHDGKANRIVRRYSNFSFAEYGEKVAFDFEKNFRISTDDFCAREHIRLIELNRRIKTSTLQDKLSRLSRKIFSQIKKGNNVEDLYDYAEPLYYFSQSAILHHSAAIQSEKLTDQNIIPNNPVSRRPGNSTS